MTDLANLLRTGVPILDVRAEIEFAKGSIPNSQNHPILNDQERAKVGHRYRTEGHESAVALGHQLVRGTVRETRVADWVSFLDRHPTSWLTCWRGGQRSSIAQMWLHEQGCDVPRIPGGYKALRTLCLHVLEQTAAEPTPWWVVAGKTGTAKTKIIHQSKHSIDLEGLAHHRGSAFGAYPTPQPAPATFENMLAVACLQREPAPLILEDESRTIGRVAVPLPWLKRMQRSPLLLVEADLDSRIEHIFDEYVTEALHHENASALQSRYTIALKRIGRRLGGERLARITGQVEQAFAGAGDHRIWIRSLLSEYYDPMYEYQLAKKTDRIAMRGGWQEVAEFVSTLTA